MRNLIKKILKEEVNTDVKIGDKVTVIATKKIGPMRWDKHKIPHVGVTFQKDQVIDKDAIYLGECNFDGIAVQSNGHERCFEPDEVKIIKNTITETIEVKKKSFKNKYGEEMTLILTIDGDILFKHDDYKDKFIPLDNLYNPMMVQKSNLTGFMLSLDKDEKEFFNNFIKGTRYKSLM